MLAKRIIEACAFSALGVSTVGLAQTVTPANSALSATIDVTKIGEPVSKYEYGMFIEHIGALIYRSLWSEMLDDRKFYFPITSKDEATTSAASGPSRMRVLRKWRPIGPEESVVMDKEHPFVGEHSPRIQLDTAEARGIQQGGLTLRKGKEYVGRIFLSGTQGAKAKVSLVWGPGPNGRQNIAVDVLSGVYVKIPLKFTAASDTSEGRLEIAATGRGSIHIGAVSLMPADNTRGFRPDTTSLLRQLDSGFWRLPGGNYISNYDWYDAVGDPDKRPPTFDYAWNAMQPNDVGMDEFMHLCKLINVEPYITVNAGFGDAHSAAEQVEYMNGSAQTRMGAMRVKNGHSDPYHVKFWNVGNEPYGMWQLGRTDLKYYVLKHNEFAKAMRNVDPSITILASGAMPDEMTVVGMTRNLHMDNIQAQFGTDADWTGGLLAHSWGYFDGITEHWYARAGKRFDLEHAKNDPIKPGVETGYVPVDETPLVWMRRPSNRVRLKADAWEEYKRRFPAMLDKKVFLSIDEYAYSGTPANLKLALAYSLVVQEMLRHTEFLKMSAFTMGVSTLDFNATDAVLNTNGVMFKFYREHFGSLPVEVAGNSPQPVPQYPVGGDQPKINAGSPTYPLDVVASLSSDHKTLTVAIVNATESVQKIELNLIGASLGGKSKLWRMTGPSLEAANKVGQPPQVKVEEIPMTDAPKILSVAPISSNIYEFAVN